MMRARAFAVALLTGLLLTTVGAALAASPGPPPPGLGMRLLEAPAKLVNDPRAHAYVIDSVPPGTSFSRKFEVSNGTRDPISVSLYITAATINGGDFVIAPGRTVNELTTWASVNPTHLTIPPFTRLTGELHIAVPKDAPAGEYYGALMSELPGKVVKGHVTVGSRVGIRMYLAVGPGGGPRSDFSIDTLVAKRLPTGEPAVVAAVHNTGGRALDMSGSLKLDQGPGALSAGPFPAKLGTTLAPGQTEPVTVILNKALPAGPWHARIDLQSGLLKRAAEGTVTFPSKAGTSAAPVKAKNISLAKNRNVLVPLAILLLLGIAIGIFLLFWKRRKRKDDEEEGRRRS